jgi:alkaline phosphatase D
VTLPAGQRSAEVRWQVTTDGPAPRVAARGTATATAARDFTVKVDVRGLESGRAYLYQFEVGGSFSPTGHTRTLPLETARLRLAVVACSNYPAGYFNAYATIAHLDDLDAVVHLGDYIYEFADGDFGDGATLGRYPDPVHEAITLEDYRRRYATYRRDPDLQALHAAHPMIAVWDDHEFADNAWTGGANNHDPWFDEGDWSVRRRAATQAYREWMPVREPSGREPFQLYRSFRFGSLATLAMLDTRTFRNEQVEPADANALRAPRRTLLGPAQEQWLYRTLQTASAAGTVWPLIGQQVMFSPFSEPGTPIRNNDAWDGYQAERGRIREFLGTLAQPVVLTGDMHSSWAFDIPRDPWTGYRAATGDGSLGVELITPAVSSPPYFTPALVDTLAPLLASSLPHLKFMEGQRRGFLLVEASPTRLDATWHFSATVTRRTAATTIGARMAVETGTSWLVRG